MNRLYTPSLSFILPLECATSTNASNITFSQLSAMLIMAGFFLLVMIALFLICRELVCWYFKINKINKNQQEILRLLKELKEKKDTQ